MTFPGFEPPEPEEEMSRGRRRTRDAKLAIAAGRHPFGRALADNGLTCGDCWFAIETENGRKTYWKCEKNRLTRSDATDLRLWWPACELFSASRPEGYESSVPAWMKRRGQR